jgi:hypothetical protein
MDFQRAIEAHVNWKAELNRYIAKPDHSLNAETVSGDANCDLGKWLKGEGQKFAATAEFKAVVPAHARFHQAAGEIVRKADAGQRMSEEVALGAKSDYALSSNAVVSALMKLKKIAA